MNMAQDGQYQDAIEIARTQFREEGLTARIHPLGIRGDSVRCDLKDHFTRTVAQGEGVGGLSRAVADSMFDALGQVLQQSERCEAPIIWADPLVLAEEPALEAEVPVRRLLEARRRNGFSGSNCKRIALREYHDLVNGERVRAPLFLSIPTPIEHQITPMTHDGIREEISTYATTAGSGIATSETEALLKGIDSLIERDALALLRIRSLSSAHMGAAPIPVIRRKSIPEELQAMVASVEADIEGGITLLDLSSDLGIPVVAAVSSPKKNNVQFMGVSAGPSAGEASGLALARLMLAVDTNMPASDVGIASLLDMETIEDVEYISLPGHDGQDVQAQLNERMTLLAESGFRILVSPTCALPSGIVAVHVLIPGLERGTGVADGRRLATGDRGRAALDAALAAQEQSAWAS